MAVDVVPPLPATTHGADGGGGGVTPSLLAPVSGVVCMFVSAYMSELLSYYVTLGISLACFARAVWPDRVDAVLVPLAAHARRAALLARADLEADLRLLRAHPATAPACAAAEACARRACAAVAAFLDGVKRRAVAKWAEHRAAAGVAWFLLRLAGRAAWIAVTVLLDAAREEAAAHAPAAMAYLRGLVPGGIGSPATSSSEGEQAKEEDDIAGFELRDVVSLVGIAFYLLFSIRFVLSFGTISGKHFYGMFLVMCGLAVMVAEWINPPDDDDSNTTAGDTSADDTTQQEGDDAGDQARLDAELEEVRGSWQFMYVLIFMAFCFDAFLLHATFGPQPTLLLLLAVCNFWVLGIGKDVQLAPDDGEGAEGGSAAAEAAVGVDEAVNTWRWGAAWVFVASSVKVLAIYLVVDFYMAALSSLWLCAMADLMLAEEDSLLELYRSGGDEDREEDDSGSGEDVNGGAEEGADEASAGAAEHSDTSSSEDEEEDYVLEERCNSSEELSDTKLSEDEEEDYVLEERCDSSEERTNAISSEDEEEDYVLEERCNSSEERGNATSSEDEAEGATEEHCDGSEEHEHLKEQRQEEPDCSSGGSMDDGWDFVEVDPEMLVTDNTGANRKSSSLLPWK
ncbi:unnamed protein product [Urochloa decumbens]|uniref:Uncharacterized protein n=1 Tax=Urochloa decumbens TaxID=240449 RepID=A0ABC9CAF0_9POAL